MSGPRSDEEVPAYLDALGIPGLVDVHVHFMPERVLRKVRAFFDRADVEYGMPWPLEYRQDEPARLARLEALRVRAFPSLVYAHKPGMSAWLNEWSLDFATRTPGCVPTATFFPEPGAADYVRDALDRGARVFKLHLQVGGYDPRDPQLRPVWGMVQEAGSVLVTHCGSGPVPGPYTGPGPIGDVLRDFPRLNLVVAHLGSPEYAGFLDLAAAYGSVSLDTTMATTDFMERLAPFPPDAVPRLRDLALAGRVHLGTDFPNIPYPYAHQLEALDRLGLGDEAMRAVLWENPRRLLGAPD